MAELEHGEYEASHPILSGLRLAVALSAVILVVESVGAYLSHSLSLTVDAVHNVPDILAFTVSWTALAGTRRGSTAEFTFGKHRLEVFAGILNGGLVLGTGAAFGFAALLSLLTRNPFAGPVDALWLLVTALPTLALRAVNLRVLGRIPGRVRDLNLASVMTHLASDIAITGALLIAGVTLLLVPSVGWVDAIGALAIAAILVVESLPLLGEGWEVLGERTPRGISVARITESALAVPGVSGMHDVHVWSVCSTLVCMTAHVDVREMSLRESMGVVKSLRETMEKEFGIVHATFEIEGPGAPA